MELLYIYIWDDKRNIKECEYNFSPNYKFSYRPQLKTFDMENVILYIVVGLDKI